MRVPRRSLVVRSQESESLELQGRTAGRGGVLKRRNKKGIPGTGGEAALPYCLRCQRHPFTFPRSPQYLNGRVSWILLWDVLGPPPSCSGRQAQLRKAGEQWKQAGADSGLKREGRRSGGPCSATRRASASGQVSPGLELDHADARRPRAPRRGGRGE